jgi:hypothetical protein
MIEGCGSTNLIFKNAQKKFYWNMIKEPAAVKHFFGIKPYICIFSRPFYKKSRGNRSGPAPWVETAGVVSLL